MRSIYLQPNSPRKRIAYVKKAMGDRVARATAYVMAHTLGEERIFEDEPIESYFDDGPPHPSEALIPWAGQYLAKLLRAVEKGNLSQREFFERQDDLERLMPQIATWVHHTRPDLTKLSIADAMSQAAVFEDPGASSAVPQGEVIYRFADGWTIQNLTKPEQIFADGIRVQNCLKEDQFGPGYVDQVRSGNTKIFSLRKPSGIPVISIEYNVPNKSFNQIYAKQNTPLGIRLEDLLEQDTWRERPADARILWENIQQYKPRIAEFLTAFGADAGAFIMADAPLPAGLTSVGSRLDLRRYAHPLPAGFTSVGGSLVLKGYAHPLPAGLTKVGGTIWLTDYDHPLPAGLTSVGGDLYLADHQHPLPAGLTSVGGYLTLSGYAHPLPAGLVVVRRVIGAEHYPYSLAQLGIESAGDRLRKNPRRSSRRPRRRTSRDGTTRSRKTSRGRSLRRKTSKR